MATAKHCISRCNSRVSYNLHERGRGHGCTNERDHDRLQAAGQPWRKREATVNMYILKVYNSMYIYIYMYTIDCHTICIYMYIYI